MYPTFNKATEAKVIDETTLKQFAIKANTICPAVILAIRRTVRVRGRINILKVSIKTKNGASALGAPAGVKWANVLEKLFIKPDKISRPQKIKAADTDGHKFLVNP